MRFSKKTVLGILSFSIIASTTLLFVSAFTVKDITNPFVAYATNETAMYDIEGVSFSDNSNDTTFEVQKSEPVISTPASLTIDGITKQVVGYNIDGTNFYSVRDLANAMVDTTGRFKLGFDNDTKSILMETGYNEPSIQTITQPNIEDIKNTIEENSKISFNINGSILSLNGSFINGNSYVNLKELSEHLGYTLLYNDITNSIEINTTQSICSYIRDVVYNPVFTYDPFTKIELSLDDINKILANTKMSNFGQYFYNMQETYGVNVVFAISVATLESGAGRALCGSYNYFGMIGKNYSSPEEGINAFGKLMNNKLYYGKSIEGIAPIYCNASWGGRIKSIMQEIWNRI